MTIDTVQQGQALCQALALGALFGLLYDLFRILRVRVKLPVVGPLLDLVFWLVATGTLFLWSQGAWGGQIRFYGALFCMAGRGILLGDQPLVFEAGLLYGGYRHIPFGNFDLPAGPGEGCFKKIRKTCEKYLSFRREMV